MHYPFPIIKDVEQVLAATSVSSAVGLAKFRMMDLLEECGELSKKEFALKLRELGKMETESPILFQVFDKKATLHEATFNYARRNSTDLKGVEKMRWLIGDHNFVNASVATEAE